MKRNRRGNFLLIANLDPVAIKITKIFHFLDTAIVFTLLATLDIWAKHIADPVYSYELTMRISNTYYVPKLLGFIINGGMILWPVLFIFTFSYIFWPVTKDEHEKYSKNTMQGEMRKLKTK